MYIGTEVPAAIAPASQPMVAQDARGQQRIVAVDRVGLEEVAARGDLRDRLVVVVRQLGIHVGVLAELVVTLRAEAVTTLRTLVVVQRAEVVLVVAASNLRMFVAVSAVRS